MQDSNFPKGIRDSRRDSKSNLFAKDVIGISIASKKPDSLRGPRHPGFASRIFPKGNKQIFNS